MEHIQEQLDVLIKVQEIDAEIYRLNELNRARPAEKNKLQDDFEQQKQELKVKEDESISLQLKRKEREIDLGSKEKEIKKYQAQLMQIKTNKEYMSMQKQIEGLKADNSVLEDEIIGLMDKIDKVKQEVVAEKDRLAAEEKRLKEEIVKIDQELAQTEEKISQLEKQRGELCVNIDQGLLTRYERILKAKSALALVPIEGESCGGCHQVLPPQIINETRMRDKMVSCEFCARLLYWTE